MKTVGILGRNGFIGKTVLRRLREVFHVADEPEPCNVLINCAGFSRMYVASQDPSKMEFVEDLVYRRIFNIPFQRLIHLSTIYIEACPNHAYSKIKMNVENRILSRWKNVTVLRLASVLGTGLQKNVIFDLTHGLPLWVTPDSVYNYISSDEIANLLIHLVNNPMTGIINVGASESVKVSDIVEMVGVNTTYGKHKDNIVMNVSKLLEFYQVKTSKEYVEEYWREFHAS